MITMLLPLIFALQTDPTPAPVALPPTPLREIGRTASRPVCTNIVVHANTAIMDSLNNDQDLTVAINHLQTTDIDGATAAERRARLADLMSFASKIRTSSSAGNAEVKRLRELAAAEKDPERKAELKEFADALGGALYRQKLAADDLAKAVTNIEGRQASTHGIQEAGLGEQTAAERAETSVMTSQATNSNTSNLPTPQPMGRTVDPKRDPLFYTDRTVKKVNEVLVATATDFKARMGKILSDEGHAADHSLGATTGC
jgi:hypothetical protein